MREGWTTKRLGEVGTFERGGGFLKSDYVEDGFPCIHYGQIHTTFGVSTHRHLTCIPEELAKLKSKLAKNGDVIIAITSEDVEGSCKCTAWLGGYDVAVGGHTAIFRHNLNPTFVSYYFRGRHYSLAKEKYAHGFKVVEIKPADIAKIDISYPSYSEQERIVAELDLLQGIIDKQKAQLKELDTLAQSIFYDMFGDPVENEKGWTKKMVKEIAQVKIGPFGSLLHASDYITGGCPVINPIHMKDGKICPDTDFTVDSKKTEEMSSYTLKKDDIIFGRRGEIGRCALVSENDSGFICGTGSLFVRFTQPIVSRFAIEVFLSNEMRKLLVDQAKGATMLNINCGIVEGLSVIQPPLPLQQSFATKIEAIERQKASINASIAETQKLFDYTMDKYFG